MAWLWNSWEEYIDTVHPVAIRPGAFGLSRRSTRLESEGRLLEALAELTKACDSLDELGFGVDSALLSSEPSIIQQASSLVLDAVYAGEQLLLYHKRLAMTNASYGFLSQHDLLEHWDRYAQTPRIAHEIQQLVKDIRELLDAYHHLAQEDEHFIIDDIDLPESLAQDFQISRDLFSVGFDEAGLLIAGRGLEGVLRQIAYERHILLEIKGKAMPAAEVDFADLIQTMSRVRWKVRGVPLISRETKALLDYLRTIRNAGAHPRHHTKEPENAREKARVIASTATKVWKSVAISRARLSSTTVEKNW